VERVFEGKNIFLPFDNNIPVLSEEEDCFINTVNVPLCILMNHPKTDV
jgi:hypothetical protein